MFDTVAAYTIVDIDKVNLINQGWKEIAYKSTFENCLVKQDSSMRAAYYFMNGRLRIEFSLPKLLYGTNSLLYNPSDYQYMIQYVNKKINVLINGCGNKVECFSRWTVTRLDICCHFIIEPEDRGFYLGILKKADLASASKILYNTGNRNCYKSYNVIDYLKMEEVKFRNTAIGRCSEKDYVKDLDKIIKMEVQLKSGKLSSLFGDMRSVKELINYSTAVSTLKDILEKRRLDNPILHKTELYKRISYLFTRTRSTNLKQYVNDLNERGLMYVSEKYERQTLYRYKKLLKDNGLSNIYHDHTDQGKIVRFADLISRPYRDSVIKYIVILMIFLHLVKMLSNVSIFLRYNWAIDFGIIDSYYYEEDG